MQNTISYVLFNDIEYKLRYWARYRVYYIVLTSEAYDRTGSCPASSCQPIAQWIRMNFLIMLIRGRYSPLLRLQCRDHLRSSCRICLTLWKGSKKVCRGPLILFLFLDQAHHQMASASKSCLRYRRYHVIFDIAVHFFALFTRYRIQIFDIVVC